MATADDYKPIELDPSDPVVKRFMRRIARHKGRVIPAQEPLPPVELKPRPPRPQQPSQPSVGATPPPTYSTNATSIPPRGGRWGVGYGGPYTSFAWAWADVLRMYPPRTTVPLRWTTYRQPLNWRVDHNLTPYASLGATVASYMPGQTTVTATFRMDTAEAAARYGHSATIQDMLDKIGEDWGGYGVSISRNVSVGAGMTIDIEVQYHV